MITEYQEQANLFLEKTGATIEISLANQTCPKWGTCEPFRMREGKISVVIPHNHGYKYNVTLKNGNRSYSFPYWTSINDTYSKHVKKYCRDGYGTIGNDITNKVKPDAYSVLVCLGSSIGAHNETFEEFCGQAGYETDSRHAFEVYTAVCDESRQIARLFNEKELEDLREIQ